jgi:hypothetical protein
MSSPYVMQSHLREDFHCIRRQKLVPCDLHVYPPLTVRMVESREDFDSRSLIEVGEFSPPSHKPQGRGLGVMIGGFTWAVRSGWDRCCRRLWLLPGLLSQSCGCCRPAALAAVAGRGRGCCRTSAAVAGTDHATATNAAAAVAPTRLLSQNPVRRQGGCPNPAPGFAIAASAL